MKTRADSRQEEFISSNGKLYINIEQEEKTDEDGGIYWEMVTLEIDDKRNAPSVIKAYKLDNIIVTLEDGTRFYANGTSRSDMSDTISLAVELGATSESINEWKTPDGLAQVTLSQLKEAVRLGLEAKATIIGVNVNNYIGL